MAPIERMPRRPYGMGDVFAELGAVQTPEVDGWLRDLAQRLSGGPDLVVTLDATAVTRAPAGDLRRTSGNGA
ncbi:hypothetical protein GCM10022419_095800 [Nonomuraea rosea]|uniref:Transposase IS701-like DDE domain-containing protein n=1 Tax=Nonomuraea rosea TaxID=638574 RepID=A0ABP6Z7D2_9ACTN